MRSKNKLNRDNKTRNGIIYLLLFLGTFLFNAGTCLLFYYPNLNDEYNVLSIAAYFAGKDWSAFASITKSYHGFGQALFYIPVFYLFEDPVWIYRAILVVNAFLISFTVPLFFYLINNYISKVKRSTAIVLSVVLGTLPCYITYAKNAWNETLCGLITLLIFVVLINWIRRFEEKKNNIFNSIVLAFLAGYGYMVHGRMLIFVGVIPVVLGISILFSRSKRKFVQLIKSVLPCIILFALFFAAMWFACDGVKSLLTENLWGHVGLNASVDDFAGRKLEYLKSFSNWIVLIKLMIGQVFYLIITTYGLAIVAIVGGAIVIYDVVINTIKKKTPHYSYIEFALAVMGYVSYASGLLLSAVSLLSGTLTANVGRVDYVLYGRYTENIYPLIVAFALIFLFTNPMKKKGLFWCCCNGLFIAISAVFMRYDMPLYLTLRRTGHSSITNILPFSGIYIVTGADTTIYKAFGKTILIALAIFVIVQILLHWKKQAALLVLLGAVSLYSFSYIMEERRIPASESKYNRVAPIRTALEQSGLLDRTDNIYLIVSGDEYPAQYQWAFDDKSCTAIFNIDNAKILEGTIDQIAEEGILISDMDVNMDWHIESCYEVNGTVFDNANHRVWIVGDALKECALQNGLELLKDDAMFYTGAELNAVNSTFRRDKVIVGDQGLVTSRPRFLAAGTYEVYVTGEYLSYCAYNAFSNAVNNLVTKYTEAGLDYSEYTVDIIESKSSFHELYLKVQLKKDVKDFEVHISNIHDWDVEVHSIEIIKN